MPAASSGTPSLSRSRAFREAALRSERYRAYGVLGIAVVMSFVLFAPGSGLHPYTRAAAMAGLAMVVSIQLGVLWMAAWAHRRQRLIPTWLALATLIIECLIPGAIMLSQHIRGTVSPYGVLNMPPVLIYGLLISLTTLRLKPLFCLLAGAICSATYASILLYNIYGLGIRQPTTGLPMAAYSNAAAIIFVSGLAAAWVARELRRHMDAALAEADTRVLMARLEQDLSVARTIQQALLPRSSPNVEGFDIAGWNRSADATGGDYYDWQELPGGNWMVNLADVSGHGIGPALVTAACRAYVRANSFYNADLASLTERMNKLLADDLPDGRFVTMASVLIEPGSPTVRLLSAGHGPIVLYIGAKQTVKDIEPQDMPLAVLADSTFGPAIEVKLESGDVLALITDGFVEWAKGGDGARDQFGTTRLRESLARHSHLGAPALISAVAADVEAFAAGEPQQDDLTMVVIKKT